MRPIDRNHEELSQRDLVGRLDLKGRHHVQSNFDHCWCVARTQRLTRQRGPQVDGGAKSQFSSGTADAEQADVGDRSRQFV